jgi:uncharacterized protein involved in exopolysaccharide biosynthesis
MASVLPSVSPIVPVVESMDSRSGKSGSSLPTSQNSTTWPTLESIALAVRRRWMLVVLCAVATAGCAFGAAQLLPNWYRSDVVAVMASKAPSGLGAALGQLGSLASLAGISLPNSESDEREEAIQYLRSETLARRFVEQNDIPQRVFASKWDSIENRWLVDDPAEAPTLNDAVDYFKRQMLVVSHDRRTGVVGVAVIWKDPSEAAELADGFLKLANEDLRRRAIAESQRKLEYLNKLASEVSDVAQRQLIFQLVQSEISFGMLANVRADYAFRIVDPAVAPDADRPVLPRRGFITVSGLFAGLLAGVVLACFLGASAGATRSERGT